MPTAPTPLLLLHAFPLDRRMWRPQLTAFEGRRPVLAPDLPGFGSRRGSPAPPDLDHWADVVAGDLEATFGSQAVAVCGLSMGGYVALRLVARHPARVAALALADTRAAADTAEGRAAREKALAAIREQGSEAFVDTLLPRLLAKSAGTGLHTWIRGLAVDQARETLENALRAMRDRPESHGVLAALRIPVTVMVGEHDALTPPDEAATMAASLDTATLEILPDAGHLANLEAPEAFDVALGRLLARVDEVSR